MARDFTFRRQFILGTVAVFLLADAALGYYSWQLSVTPRFTEKTFQNEVKRQEILKADLKRAQAIRESIPNIQKDCDNFEHSLLPASNGFSRVRAELGVTAQKSGILLEDASWKPTEVQSRGMKEIAIDVTVSGPYKSVITFLNGLQRSSTNYAVDALTLASDNNNQSPSGIIKVALHLHTYFRAAA